MIRNNKGFSLVLIMSLLPAALAAFFTVSSVMGLLQFDLATKYPCRNQGLITQRQVSPLLVRLLALNKRATKLRNDLTLREEELASAIAAQNHIVISKAQLQINILVAKRAVLDLQQKQLIQQSNLQLSRGHRIANVQLEKALSTHARRLHFFELSSKVTPSSPPSLAVRPDYPDTAPTYSPTMNFEADQSLAHSWQYTVTMATPFKNFIKGGPFEFKKSCSVTLSKESSRWVGKINGDKSLSNSLW